jgi:CRISPR system Cascade subunit CasE
MSEGACWLSRITARAAIGPRDLVALGGMDPYHQHRALYALFDLPHKEERKGQPSPFLFRAEHRDGLPVFYVLSQQIPLDAKSLWEIEPREFKPDIRDGDSLAFKLRANPVVARSEEKGQRGKRHDVVMDAKRQMKWQDIPQEDRPSLAQVAHKAGVGWLGAKAATLGFAVNEESLRVDGYAVWRQSYGKRIELATLDFEGALTVTDALKFRQALLHGVGPAKGFGCGLLLVRRIKDF